MEYGTKNRLWASKNIPNAVMVRTLPRMVTRQNSSPSTVRPTVESLKVAKGRIRERFRRLKGWNLRVGSAPLRTDALTFGRRKPIFSFLSRQEPSRRASCLSQQPAQGPFRPARLHSGALGRVDLPRRTFLRQSGLTRCDPGSSGPQTGLSRGSPEEDYETNSETGLLAIAHWLSFVG